MHVERGSGKARIGMKPFDLPRNGGALAARPEKGRSLCAPIPTGEKRALTQWE